MDTWLRLCRNLYNAALQHRRDAYRMAGKSVSVFEQSRELTEIRKADPEYAAVPRRMCRNALDRLDLAFKSFFRRIKAGQKPGYPRFQGRDRYNSLTIDTGVDAPVEGNRVRVPKLGWIKFHLYRPIKGRVLEVHLKRMARRWDICFACDLGEAPQKVAVRPKRVVGIDLGLSSFAVLSNGERIENPRYFRNGEEALARRQRSLGRKKRGSKSRWKARRLVAAAHEHVRNQRQEFHRKVAAQLVGRFDLIAHEDLNVKGLARGMLSKSVGDAGWAGFISALQSKAEWAGKWIVPVNPWNTSQACSECGQLVPKNLGERVHRCDCGLVMDRDENAARNVLSLAAGRAVPVIGAQSILGRSL